MKLAKLPHFNFTQIEKNDADKIKKLKSELIGFNIFKERVLEK